MQYDLDFYEAVEFDHLEAVISYSQNVDLNYLYDSDFTVLMLAAYYGHTEIVKWLLQKGATRNIKNSTGQSALDIALEHNHQACIALLK